LPGPGFQVTIARPLAAAWAATFTGVGVAGADVVGGVVVVVVVVLVVVGAVVVVVGDGFVVVVGNRGRRVVGGGLGAADAGSDSRMPAVEKESALKTTTRRVV
jgi:hypothetical protein